MTRIFVIGALCAGAILFVAVKLASYGVQL